MWILGVLFVIQHVGIAVSDALAVPQVKFNHVCQSTFAPPGVAGVGAAPLVYDLILLVLTSIKCYQAIFCQSTRARNSLWHTILRDGVLSFLAVCGRSYLHQHAACRACADLIFFAQLLSVSTGYST
jgi:hypothetical protein